MALTILEISFPIPSDGDIDEVKIRNSQGENITVGVRDAYLPYPGP